MLVIQQLTSSCGISEDRDVVLCRLHERTWIGTDSTPALFTPWMWNQHENVLACLPRSSNFAERWQNAFQCLMGCSNPTIWRFIDVLKEEQDLTNWKINQKMMRQSPRPHVELPCVSNYSPGNAMQFDSIEL